MLNSSSRIALHLKYRVWIAEMNRDINLIRIYQDYLDQLTYSAGSNDPKGDINETRMQLVSFRPTIDELKNDMHLLKMKLGATSQVNPLLNGHEENEERESQRIESRYKLFRAEFDTFQSHLVNFITAPIPQ